MPPPFKPKGLGEIALRCAALDPMVAFYRDVIGLDLLDGGDRGNIVFFRLSEGVAGHTAVLALFGPEGDPSADVATGTGSSLHHLALSLPFAEQEAVLAWYRETGRPHRIEHFDWVGWRGIFVDDPEGNTVELVARLPADGQSG